MGCCVWQFRIGGLILSEEITKTDHGDKKDGGERDGYEKTCYLCQRPESKVEKMMTISNITICSDCMQKAFDQIRMQDIPNLGPAVNTGGPSDQKGTPNIPGIEFINLANVFGGGMTEEMQARHSVKPKKKKKKEEVPVLDIQQLPAPHVIKGKLDDFVMGQDEAKKVISVGVYNHYKRVLSIREREKAEENGDLSMPGMDVEIEKSNMLMLGPTGSGKTYLVKTLARLLQVPLAITDATALTEAGYIGDDVESVISKLLSNADNDVERAESGIVYIDEIDKLAKKENANHRDVSGESVQQALLKLLEGADVEVPVGASNKNAMVPMTTVNTSHILFICGGAFPGLEKIIKKRLTKHGGIGFGADLKDRYDDEKDIFSRVETEDIRNYGLIPEFIGRLPIIFSLSEMDENLLVKVLTEPKNAIVKQYQKLLSMDEVKLDFDEDALLAIAGQAVKKKTGARALRSIIEKMMLDIMYEIPKDDMIGKVTITRDYIEGTGAPRIEMRGS